MSCECGCSDPSCPSGQYGCGCCCASVTGLKGRLPPDVIRSTSVDMFIDTADTATKTHQTMVVVTGPIHIVSVTAALVCVHRDTDGSDPEKQLKYPTSAGAAHIAQATPCMFSLFTLPAFITDNLDQGGWSPDGPGDLSDAREYIVSAGLSVHAPAWTYPEDMFGYFCDGGLFIEMNAPHNKLGIRVTVNYVERLQFPPAYHDPVEVMQHYWKCSHGELEFLDASMAAPPSM